MVRRESRIARDHADRVQLQLRGEALTGARRRGEIARMGTAAASPQEDRALEQLADLNRKLADVEVDQTMWPQIVDSLPDGLIVVDESGRIRLVNVQVELMFGYHRSRLIGEPIHMLLDPQLASAHAGHLERFFAAPSARPMNLAKHLSGRHASGRSILVQISIGPLVSEAGVFGLAIVRRIAPPAGTSVRG